MDWSKKNILFLLLIFFMVLLTIYGRADAWAKETITFGCAISLTGKHNLTGKRYVDSYNLAKEQINKKGGLKAGDTQYPIEIVYYDDKSDASESEKLVKKLVQEDRVDFLLGPYSSEITLAAVAVAEAYKTPMVQGGGASRDIFSETNKYVFGTLPPAEQYFRTTLEMMTTFHPKPERIAVVFEESLFHSQVAEGVRQTAKEIGLTIAMYEKISEASVDVGAILGKIKSLTPDALLVSCRTPNAVNLIRQAREQNAGLKMLSMTLAASEAGFREALGTHSEYIFGVSSWSPRINFRGVVFEDTKTFVDMFKKKYGYDPDYHNASAVAVLSVFKYAVEKAGTYEPERVRKEIAAIKDLETVYGVITFKPDGQITGSSLVLQVQNGGVYQVYPKSIKVPVYPIPNWDRPHTASPDNPSF